MERAIAFEDVHHNTDRVDAAYRAKYGRPSYVDAMVTPDAAAGWARRARSIRGLPGNWKRH